MEGTHRLPANGDGVPPLTAWKGRKAVLGAGFGAVIALLVISTVEAYRIQSTVSDKHVEIYRLYLEEEEALAQLRRNVLVGSTFVRDFFMSGRPDRAAALRGQLRDLEKQNRDAIARLESRQQSGVLPRAFPHDAVDEYWRVLMPIPDTMEHVSAAAAYDMVQRDIVPRRSAAYAALRQITEMNQHELQSRELAFANSRRAAVQRLSVILGVCVVLGLLFAWLALRQVESMARQAARHYEEVLQTKSDLQQLSARLLEVQEEERRRLSRGLHDEIGQTLTALRLEISHAVMRAAVPEVRERLERARALAERTVQSVRDISLVLRPALLDDLGLVPALQWQLEDFGRRSGIVCEFAEQGVQDNLPDSVKTCVYRVVQEALNNCEKHAAASRVTVSLRQDPDHITVEVRDDGRGFEPDPDGLPRRGDGIGLLGMRERASRLGGQLVMESAPGRGTRIGLEIPLADLNRPRARAVPVGEGA